MKNQTPKNIDVETISELPPLLPPSCISSAKQYVLDNIIMINAGPPNEHALKNEENQIGPIMEMLPHIEKRQAIDESDNKYEENMVKKIMLNKGSNNDNDGITFIDKSSVHPRDRLNKINPNFVFDTSTYA